MTHKLKSYGELQSVTHKHRHKDEQWKPYERKPLKGLLESKCQWNYSSLKPLSEGDSFIVQWFHRKVFPPLFHWLASVWCDALFRLNLHLKIKWWGLQSLDMSTYVNWITKKAKTLSIQINFDRHACCNDELDLGEAHKVYWKQPPTHHFMWKSKFTVKVILW